jgi:hypothetical protein
MPTFGPIKLQELISCLRKLGFNGPYSGGKHQFMVADAAHRSRIQKVKRWDAPRRLMLVRTGRE